MDHANGPVFLPSGAAGIGEFVAHTASVTCLSLGPKTGRLLATGSEDRKVNLWPVGKANCLSVSPDPVPHVMHRAFRLVADETIAVHHPHDEEMVVLCWSAHLLLPCCCSSFHPFRFTSGSHTCFPRSRVTRRRICQKQEFGGGCSLFGRQRIGGDEPCGDF